MPVAIAAVTAVGAGFGANHATRPVNTPAGVPVSFTDANGVRHELVPSSDEAAAIPDDRDTPQGPASMQNVAGVTAAPDIDQPAVQPATAAVVDVSPAPAAAPVTVVVSAPQTAPVAIVQVAPPAPPTTKTVQIVVAAKPAQPEVWVKGAQDREGGSRDGDDRGSKHGGDDHKGSHGR
ncbi:MAG: hypothetical protein JOZ39_07095 [Chloroflexi bacterium]|nr:hypothetical protein [Chloroflexota bacterium]